MNDVKVLEKNDTRVSEIRVETAAVAVAEREKALVFAHYELALRHPRNIEQARQDLLKECKRPRFAEGARYNKPIGNGVQGPSIRFAEAAIRCFRNIMSIITTTYDDIEKRIVNVRVIDLETNIAYSQDVTVTKTVERKTIKQGEIPLSTRINSQNKKIFILPATDDDILNKQNALISKSLRTQALRLIPDDIIEECMDVVINTQNSEDAEDPDAAKRKIFDSFTSISVSASDIQEYLGNTGENLTPKELADLRGIYQAIRDGELSWRDVMDRKNPKGDAPKGSANQTPRQKYETLKAQLEAAGKKDDMTETIVEFSGKIAKGEKEFDDADLVTITPILEKLLASAK